MVSQHERVQIPHLAINIWLFDRLYMYCPVIKNENNNNEQTCWCFSYISSQDATDPSHKSHNASDKYPTMHHFVTEMCTHVHISVTKWCNVNIWTGAFWDLWDWFIVDPYYTGVLIALGVNIMAVDALAPCITRSSPWCSLWFILYEKLFQLQCGQIIYRWVSARKM